MKKILILLMVALLLSSCGMKQPSAPVSPDATPSSSAAPDPTETVPAETAQVAGISDYFPFHENLVLRYSGEGSEYAEFVTYVEYLSNGAMQLRTVNPGAASVSVYVAESGCLKRVYRAGETYGRTDFTALRETEEILLMEPLTQGTSWTLASGALRSITSTMFPVMTPLGCFEALEVTTAEESFVTKEYYAKGVGLIQREFMSTDGEPFTVSSRLESMDEGLPFTLFVRVCYPSFDQGLLNYAEETLSLYTNDDVSDPLGALWKTEPEDSGPDAVLSENTVINKLGYDPRTALPTVDFSSGFVSDMNAGAQEEALKLLCIVNTIAGLFYADRALITVDGIPYVSDWITSQEGGVYSADWSGVTELQKK